MKKVQLQVNVINQLKLLRQSTFKDILCFLDEDVQNAQRAKSTEVRINVDHYAKKVIISNNGKVLKNPQSLFSIAESEWDDDVKNTENPFGMGFFSNITVSNLIQVHSGNNSITFDVQKMIDTNDTEIKVEAVDDYYDGFELTLNNFDFNTAATWDIEARIAILGKYIQNLDVYYNGALQEKKDLTEGDDSPFQLAIRNESDFTGWISLGNNYCWGDNINIFYKGRLVCKLEGMPYLVGDLHVSDRTLNLTSPDRKDIIKDVKLGDFKELIRLYAENLCDETILSYADDRIDEYTSALGYYIDKKKIKNSVKFKTFKSNDPKDCAYIKGIALARTMNVKVDSFKSYEVYLRNEAKDQPAEHFESVEVKPKMVTMPPEAKGVVIHNGDSSYSSGYVETPQIDEEALTEVDGEMILDNSEPVFYIGFTEVEKYELKLNVARHYSLKIIVARNKVEESILKSMRDSDNVLHISELDELVSITGNLSDTTLSVREQRAMMLFDMISRIVGYDHNVFAIGNLMVTKNIRVESIGVNQDIIADDIVVLKDSDAGKIYVDRSIIEKDSLRDDTEENLDLNDYKFLLGNLLQIIKELRLLDFGASKHYLKIILDALGSEKFYLAEHQEKKNQTESEDWAS